MPATRRNRGWISRDWQCWLVRMLAQNLPVTGNIRKIRIVIPTNKPSPPVALNDDAPADTARKGKAHMFTGIIGALGTVESITPIEGSDAAYLTLNACLLYTSPSPRDVEESRMPSSA